MRPSMGLQGPEVSDGRWNEQLVAGEVRLESEGRRSLRSSPISTSIGSGVVSARKDPGRARDSLARKSHKTSLRFE
jgi:hypothetical protein